MLLDKSWFKVLAGTILLCLLGPLSINMPGYLPITLQSLGVVLVPMIFGWRFGLISIVAYLLLGAFGVPVFADFKSGFEVFSTASTGFLFGFLPAGFVAGFYANKVPVSYGRYFFVFVGAHLVLLLCGVLGMLFMGFAGDQVWNNVVFLFPGLMIKSFFGAFLVLAVKMKKS
jgi:biotin transport system substrate-specific component